MRVDTEFLDKLSSPRPTPGGGGACAYCGALAVALAQMVANLAARNARCDQKRARDVLEKLTLCREKLILLISEDANAFQPLSNAYAMPHTTEEEQEMRTERIQIALIGACEAPLHIMQECKQVIDLCDEVAEVGSHMALPDVGAAALLAEAAMHGASLDVFINAHSMHNREKADAYTAEADDLAASISGRPKAIFDRVMKEVR